MIYNSYEVADLIGVNVSTVKRWADSGKIDCYKTKGGHRKFHLKHLREFIKSDKTSSVAIDLSNLVGNNKKLIEAINDSNTEVLIDYSYKALINRGNYKFLSLMNSLLIKGYQYDYLFDQIIIPILEKIGKQWSIGKLSITQEHMASEVIKKFIINIDESMNPNSRKHEVYCLTLVNDKHDLPIYMAENILNQSNTIKTYNLGPNLPVDDLISELNSRDPKLIFVSIVYIENKDIANEEINKLLAYFTDSDCKILLSGRGVDLLDITYNNYTRIKSYSNLQNFISESF
tara:strand:- start:1336 stop:2199 length:864 start_codon:yes stop_codon:yes gene_type:complete